MMLVAKQTAIQMMIFIVFMILVFHFPKSIEIFWCKDNSKIYQFNNRPKFFSGLLNKWATFLTYTERNAHRIEDFHQLDVSLTFKPKMNFGFRYQISFFVQWLVRKYNTLNKHSSIW